MDRAQHTGTLLVPILDVATIAHLLPLALTISQARSCGVMLLDIVEVEAEQQLSTGVVAATRRRDLLQSLIPPTHAVVRTSVRVARTRYEGICDAVRDEVASLLLLGWQSDSVSSERLFGPPLEDLVAGPPCDLLIVKQTASRSMRRILLPTRGGPHLELGLEIALALATREDGSVTLLVANDGQGPVDPNELTSIRRHEQLPQVTYRLQQVEHIIPGILQEATNYDTVILGTTGRRASEPSVGPLGETLLKESDATVIIACHKLAQPEEQAVARFEAHRDIAAVVDQWFAQNTFSADEFANVEHLLTLKQHQGLRISLVLPALNEEATIGPLIDVLKRSLMEQVPLVDEMVLVDSNSTDATRSLAADRQIPVHIHQEILPNYGAFAGKGEALWKSLHVTSGDIVVWLDTDVHHMHPRFVYGLVGPLLREPRLQFTKGFYRRPIMQQGQLVESGGGRVTELVARPLFNLFYPALSGFVQPLAGEYAARRTVLERLPFFTGYGVETGLLIDMLNMVGLDALAQVDLQQRIHRNQELDGLSRMAFAIIQVVIQRLETRQRLHLIDPLNQSLNLIQYVQDGGFHLNVQHVRDHERPPMQTIPEYGERQLALRRAA